MISFAVTGDSTACSILTTGPDAGKLSIDAGTGICKITATRPGDASNTETVRRVEAPANGFRKIDGDLLRHFAELLDERRIAPALGCTRIMMARRSAPLSSALARVATRSRA